MKSAIQQATNAKRFGAQWLLWCAVMAVLGAYIANAQFSEYQSLRIEEKSRLKTQVRVAEQLIHSQVQSADAALRTMLDSLDRWKGTDGYLPFAHEHLKRVEKMMPGVRTFAVLDAKGICRLSNQPELIGKDFSHRPYFQHPARTNNPHLLHIAPPYQTVLKAWATTISRSITNKNGTFDGVVVATLSPDYFQTLMKNLSFGNDMRVSLMHDEGEMYVTWPQMEDMSRLSFTRDDNFINRHWKSGALESDYEGPGFDGTDRIATVRNISLKDLHADHGFLAVASRDTDKVFEEWYSDTAAQAAIWLIATILTGIALSRYQARIADLIKKARIAEQALIEMAYRDPLTDAENRRSFVGKLENEYSRVQRSHTNAALIMLDIDFFKKINDTYGHDGGDVVLKHLVNLLQNGLRRIDTLGRLGGEEFAILLPGTPYASALDLAERLRTTVENSSVKIGEHTVSITISLGVAPIHMSAKDTDGVMKNADLALYQAKHTGRNRVCASEAA
jgi:diguanylate cyclase (GGDEF)-like protein